MENMNDYERREERLSSSCRKRSADEESSNHKSKKPSPADSIPNAGENWTTTKESESESGDKSAELESCDDSESETSLNYDYGLALAQPNHHNSLRATTMKYPDPYQKWLPIYSAHQHQPLNLNMNYYHHPNNNKAQPLLRAAWAGAFSVKPVKKRNIVAETFDGLKGCVSSKACREARLVAEQLPPLIRWEKLPKLCVWHRKFEERGPTDDDIALFFLPSLSKYESAYDSLVFDLIRGDLAMRTTVMGAELLLFTSVDLPPLSTRFQGKLYLWGVFRGNHPLRRRL